MVVLNERERRVLLGLGVILLVGGAVRLVGATWPALTPGLVTVADEARVPDPPADGRDHPRLGQSAHADSLFPGGTLDLNAAGERELRLLPGIGPALAGRVVAHRDARGGFTGVDELLEVRGIGPAILGRIRAHVVVRPRAAEPDRAPTPGTAPPPTDRRDPSG